MNRGLPGTTSGCCSSEEEAFALRRLWPGNHGGCVGQSGDTANCDGASLRPNPPFGAGQKLPENPKGDPLEIARIAGIGAAKRTAELIPMCHPLMLSHVEVAASIQARGVRIRATVSTTGPTGVEMEALTAAAVAALTIYDMTKALDKGIEIQDLYLIEKTGGKSGDFRRGGRR